VVEVANRVYARQYHLEKPGYWPTIYQRKFLPGHGKLSGLALPVRYFAKVPVGSIP
jgi:hypothetical protein